MNIPFYDLSRENKKIKQGLLASFKNSFQESRFILGKNVELFEREWAKYLGTNYALGVANGTDALILSIKALGIGIGDEVIVPAYTFVATAFAVTLNGAVPVFVDVDPETHMINPKLIEKAITKKTKAIIPVHLYGSVAPMSEILQIAKRHKLFVVEDAAQAHGAEFKGKKAGTIGNIGCYSFYPAKNLGALGDGGAVVTSGKKMGEMLFSLRNYGQSRKYYSERVGCNSRLDEIQAGFLLVKLKHLDSQNKKRRSLAKLYRKKLKGLSLKLPLDVTGSLPVHHLFTVQVNNRDIVMKKLEKMGIQTLIHYPVPLHLQKAYKNLGYNAGSFPVSEEIAKTTLSLPFFPSMTEKQVNYVVGSLKKVI